MKDTHALLGAQVLTKLTPYPNLTKPLLLYPIFSLPHVLQFLASVKTERQGEGSKLGSNRGLELSFKMQTNLPFLLDGL